MAGIVGYGAYIPSFRLKLEDIWDMWVNPIDTPSIIKQRRRLSEKAVTRWDEDSMSMAVQASKASLEMAGIYGKDLGAIWFGSSTNPCTSRPSATNVAEALSCIPETSAADCQFASKSGTVALQACAAMADAGMARYSLAIGSDALSRHVAPNDALEYSASCGAAAFVIGKDHTVADIENTYSYNTLNPEFYRLDCERYIKHGAGEEEEYFAGYSKYVKAALEGYMKKFGVKPGDYASVVISQPDGRLPSESLTSAGFTEEQFGPWMMAGQIGDCGSASSLLSLQLALDKAKSGQKILLVSYGSGAGCDIFGLKVTALISDAGKRRKDFPSVPELLSNKEYISYAQYLRQERKLAQEFI
jgi:hydroxymethylglutaryl-CoA synthase